MKNPFAAITVHSASLAPLWLCVLATTVILGWPDMARANDQRDDAVRDQLEQAQELVGEADDVLQEYATGSAASAKLVRQARAKARADTDRSRFPAMVEGVAMKAAGVLGFGPVADTLAALGTTIAVAGAGVVVGRRRRKDAPSETEDDEPDERRPGGASRRFPAEEARGGRDQNRDQDGAQGRHHAASQSPLMSSDAIDMPRAPSQRNRMVVTP